MAQPQRDQSTPGVPVRTVRHRNLSVACLALSGLIAMLLLAFANRSAWSVDFNQYYSAGLLAGTGHLYDGHSILALELQRNSTAVPFGRLPVYAFAMKPLSALPYPVARVVFFLTEVAALAGFIALWPFPRRDWALEAVCWSAPVAMCLAFGQDSVLFLFFVTLGLWLLLRGRNFGAGLAFSICASKPHLAVMLPFVLAARKNYTALLGGVSGIAILLLLSFAVEGPQWPARLLALARLPDFDPAPGRMPNLRGLLSFFGGNLLLELALAVIAAGAIWILSARIPLKSGITVALAGGLMLSHHAYSYDALLLLPALLLPFENAGPEWLRLWALILITPVPYMLLLTSVEFPAHFLITGYTVAFLTVSWLIANPVKASPELAEV
jgi:hypothetical protein